MVLEAYGVAFAQRLKFNFNYIIKPYLTGQLLQQIDVFSLVWYYSRSF